MRHLTVIAFTLLFLSHFDLASQSIIAGQYTVFDNYVDKDPDTLIRCALTQGCTSHSFYFDMNEDGVNDFKFYLENDPGGNGFDHFQIKIAPFNDNQVVFGRTDSCEGIYKCAGMFFYYDMAETLLENDTIDDSNEWYQNNDNWLYLISDEFVGLCIANCYHTIGASGPVILGTRILIESDTLYGWMRLSGIMATSNYVRFYIDEYAWNKTPSFSIYENPRPQVKLHPNPFTTSTTIEYELTEPSHVQLSIYNAIGEVVFRAEDRMIPVGKHSFIWTADRLPEGMYYAVLRSEEGVSVVKMVKQ